MPATFRDLPPDHPIFSIGPSFVLGERVLDDEQPSGEDDLLRELSPDEADA